MSSQRYGHILNSLEAELQRRFKDARCHLTGGAVMIEAMKHHILRTQVESFALALAIISVVLLLAAGNLRLGVFAVAGNLGPIVVVLGVMGWCGIALEVSNILVATIAIGIVVDDTIHIIHGYRRERQSRGAGDDAAYEAVGAALASSGRAILFTTMVLSLTFAVYVGSSLSNIRDFGLLVVTTFVAALAADLIVLPALMLAWPPQGKGTA
jgi:hypothetical protein